MEKFILFLFITISLSSVSTNRIPAPDKCDDQETVDPDGNGWRRECCTNAAGVRTCGAWEEI